MSEKTKNANPEMDADVSIDDVLEFIKKSEKQIKGRLLLNATKKIKGYTKEINLLKLKVMLLLEEIGLGEKERQRFVDFINELQEVKNVPENIVNQIKEEQREQIIKDRRTNETIIEKKTDEVYHSMPMFYGNNDLNDLVYRGPMQFPMGPNMNTVHYNNNTLLGGTVTNHTTSNFSNLSNACSAACAISIPFGDETLVVKL